MGGTGSDGSLKGGLFGEFNPSPASSVLELVRKRRELRGVLVVPKLPVSALVLVAPRAVLVVRGNVMAVSGGVLVVCGRAPAITPGVLVFSSSELV